MSIWLVTGTSGQYSDRRDWNVKAFSTKEGAEQFKAYLEAADDLDQQGEDFEWFGEVHEAHVKKMQQLDKGYSEYSETDYDIEEVEYVA